MKLWSLAMSLAVCSLTAACGSRDVDATGQPPVAASVPPPPTPPDVGQIDRFLACTAKSRRELSARERCEVEAFRSRCTPLDDCYVSCINSPDGVRGGGRCAHVCTFGFHRGEPPPEGVTSCSVLAGPSGIDVELPRRTNEKL